MRLLAFRKRLNDTKKKGEFMKTFYINGTILTMEENNLYAEAVCTENGIIQAVGTKEELLKLRSEGDRIVDLEGKTMLPGLIDGHSHFAGTANAMTQCDLSLCNSFADIIREMKNFKEKRKLSDDAWIVGCNYDHNFLAEGKHPDRFILDQISDTNPVLLIHASSHMGVTNSKGLELQGIDETAEDRADGRYGRVEGTSTPNGYMEEKVFLEFQSKLPMTSVEELMNLFREAQKLYASYGITTVQDGMVARPLFQLLKTASDMGILKLDIVGYVDIMTAAELPDEMPEYDRKYHKHLKLGGYKIFLDGSPQGKTAWMLEPYVGEESYCGYPIHSDEVLESYIRTALEKKQQLLAHCNGDAAAEQYITGFEKVLASEKSQDTYRAVMVHAQLVRREQLRRMAKLGMMPSFFVAHTYYWGDIHLKNFGIERGSRISPAKDAVDCGMKFTFHQDSPVVPPDMMRTVSCAVNRISRTGQDIGKEQRIPVLEALKAVTSYGAYQYHEEDRKGTISVGKLADFAVLDKNPLEVDPEMLAEVQVMMTVKEDQMIYERGKCHE